MTFPLPKPGTIPIPVSLFDPLTGQPIAATDDNKTIQTAVISGTGTLALVSAIGGKQVHVTHVWYTCDTDGTTAQMQDTDGVALEGNAPHAQYGGKVISGQPSATLYEPAIGKGLQLVVAVGHVYGAVRYYQE